VYQQIQRERLETPPGSKTIYSDLGFMLLGAAVEEVSGQTLDRFCHDKIYRPLGLRATAFVDLMLLRTRRLAPITEMIAPTEHCPWRKRVLCGEVHDDNAFAMGGVAGHAGLFSSAAEIDTLLCRLESCFAGADDFVPPAVIQTFWRVDGTVPGSTWALDGCARRGSRWRRALLAAHRRSPRIYRNFDLDRSRSTSTRHPAFESRPSHPRERCHSRAAAHDPRPDQSGPG
jgi:CubicO group peptidase (beta-lactamase class C family)